MRMYHPSKEKCMVMCLAQSSQKATAFVSILISSPQVSKAYLRGTKCTVALFESQANIFDLQNSNKTRGFCCCCYVGWSSFPTKGYVFKLPAVLLKKPSREFSFLRHQHLHITKVQLHSLWVERTESQETSSVQLYCLYLTQPTSSKTWTAPRSYNNHLKF